MMKKRSLKIDRLRFDIFYIVDVFYLQGTCVWHFHDSIVIFFTFLTAASFPT